MPKKYVRKRRVIPRSFMPPAQDWRGIITAAIKAGVAKARIADSCGMSREKVYSALIGRYEPTWSEGHALVALLTHLDDQAPPASVCSSFGTSQFTEQV